MADPSGILNIYWDFVLKEVEKVKMGEENIKKYRGTLVS